MDVSIKLTRISELSESDRTEVRALALAVYPPEVAATWPGRHLEWASFEWCVRVWGSDGELASYAGLLLREGTHDMRSVLLGGVGGVATHPAARRRGYAEKGLRMAVEFFRENPKIAFALLVCEENLIPYYTRLGWQKFGGELIVRQHGEPGVFTFNCVMTLGIASEAPLVGTIDLRGPPW
ncbi:MAG TPA: GNAT family N-acetyltransferase [Anaerolineales bacterium]|nr:GNAT family N-acetyltransferase [Anaerolineales bacterium]